MVAERKQIKLVIGPKACNAAFRPYLQSRARFRLFWGGRDSSKSDFVALDLLLQCLTLPYFKCVLVRRYANTIKGSQWDTLERVARREGLHHLFIWGVNPLGIKCKLNRNSFVPFGMDDMGKAKSLSDPTHAWYEEANQTEEADADVLSTSLRSSVPGAVFQEIYSFNPDHEGDYKTFWLWKKFFDRTGHPSGTTFSGTLAVDVDGQLIELPYEVLHSTARDNQWCPPERLATYKGYQFTDPYRYRVWYEGLWATKQTGNEFFPGFSRAKHVKATTYVPGVNILQSWDANALPYCAMLCAQPLRLNGKLIISIFKEYALRPPNSGLGTTGKQFLLDRQANQWASSDVALTGDASLRARKVGDGNQSNFKDIEAVMAPALNTASTALWPYQNTRVLASRDFLNFVFRGGLPDVEVWVDPGCVECIADWELAQLGIEGVYKERFTDKELGVSYEKRGHFVDVGRYLITTLLRPQYEAFLAVRPA